MIDSLKQVVDSLSVSNTTIGSWWTYVILFVVIVTTMIIVDPWLKHGKFF